MTSLANLNQCHESEFLSLLGSVYEHSEWVARGTFAQLPFSSRECLIQAMAEQVEAASNEARLTLIKAHPDLGGKLARAGKLTEESTKEQAGLGLDRLSEEEYQQFTSLNAAYLKRFGFPFIICAKLHTRPQVLAAFNKRLNHTREAEIAEAMRQIHDIARLRIEEKIEAGES